MASLLALSKAHGISYHTLMSRLIKRKMSIDDALNTPVRKKMKGIRISCELAGRNEESVRKRMKNGMTLEQALAKPTRKKYAPLNYDKIKQLVEVDKLSLNSTAYLLNITRHNLANFCRKHGIVYDDYNPPSKKIMIDGVEHSERSACIKMGWSKTSFYNFYKLHEITDIQSAFDKYRDFKSSEQCVHKTQTINTAIVIELVAQGLSVADIARKTGYSRQGLNQHIKSNNINYTPQGNVKYIVVDGVTMSMSAGCKKKGFSCESLYAYRSPRGLNEQDGFNSYVAYKLAKKKRRGY